MLQSIENYQKAFEKLVSILNNNKKIITVFAFGSIVNGDLWDESDIDIFAVYKDSFEDIRDIYSEILDIPVHLKILNKKEFINLYKSKKESIINMLISSKIIISKDDEIEDIYNSVRYTLDKHIEIKNLVYLGNLIKDFRIAKKFYQNDSPFTSYEVLIRALLNFSKLYLNLNGYNISKDSIKMAVNLNPSFDKVVSNLFYNGASKENIEKTLHFIETFLDRNISIAAKALINYLKDQEDFLSSYEIKNNSIFKDFSINVEDILKELFKRNIVIKKKRKINLEKREKLIDENVYSI